VDAKQYLNGESGSPVNLSCEMNKYGELKALVSGTTSVQGSANPGNKTCFRTLARTIDQSANELCGTDASCVDLVQTATIFPSTSSADGVCANFADGDTNAYLIHIAEGVDQTALNEFDDLFTATTTDGCLFAPQTAIIHGTALGATEFTDMATFGMGLVWSPKSNVFLYGAGTDLTKTTDIPLARSMGILVGMGPDWAMGGSQNMLEELRFADMVDNTIWGDSLSTRDLVEMATMNSAELLGVGDQIGSLFTGMKADIAVISGDIRNPYDAIVAAEPEQVRLVLVDGHALYGDDQLISLGAPTPGCEIIDVCGEPRCSVSPSTAATAQTCSARPSQTSRPPSPPVSPIMTPCSLPQWTSHP
jgi:5-methylthioadenosine/S-adenosylhomocysteine deaminase